MEQKILFIGGGAIATALGNVLARKKHFNVTLLTIEDNVCNSINQNHINQKYFPNIFLNERLRASTDHSLLEQQAIVFLAIPSTVTVEFLKKQRIHPKSMLVNLAKGFGGDGKTIAEILQQEFPNPVCTMKGPSFAREILNNQPTGFTVGAESRRMFNDIKKLFTDTTVFVDHTHDMRGVEILSILKNIYAIAIGVVDAQFESPNQRFLIFTRAFGEMRKLHLFFGGSKKTLFNYCGIGDFALTSLNDLSRNRTLGLLIGKGFFTEDISEKVVLEGRIAVNIFYDEVKNKQADPAEFPILTELYRVFNSEYDISGFVGKILE